MQGKWLLDGLLGKCDECVCRQRSTSNSIKFESLYLLSYYCFWELFSELSLKGEWDFILCFWDSTSEYNDSISCFDTKNNTLLPCRTHVCYSTSQVFYDNFFYWHIYSWCSCACRGTSSDLTRDRSCKSRTNHRESHKCDKSTRKNHKKKEKIYTRQCINLGEKSKLYTLKNI